MAKTATINVTDDGEPAHDPLEGIDAITPEEATQAFAITDELRGTAGITLQFTRAWPNTPGMVGHCGEMAAEEYSLAEAARRYGPGRYVVRLRGPAGYVKGGGKLNIAGNPQASAAPQGGNSAASDATLQLLEAMNRRQDDQQRAADARREKLWALALAAMPVLPAIIGALKGGGGDNLTTALIQALKPQQQMTPADMVSMVTQLKDLSGAGEKTDPIDQLSKLLTVARDLGGAGEGGAGSNWIDLVRDGLKAAPDILSGLQRQGPQTQTVHVAPAPEPVPILQPQSAPAQPAPTEGADMWVLIQPVLRDAAQKIEQWAKDGKNAELRAEVLLDDLPQWMADRLKPAEALQFLNHPQWWEHLTAFHPPLAAYRNWIDTLRAELIDIVTEQLKDEKPGNEDTPNG